MTTFPKHIKFVSDDTEASFKEELTGKAKVKIKEAYYVFTKSNSNLGGVFLLSLPQIEKMLDNNIIKL